MTTLKRGASLDIGGIVPLLPCRNAPRSGKQSPSKVASHLKQHTWLVMQGGSQVQGGFTGWCWLVVRVCQGGWCAVHHACLHGVSDNA